MAKRVADLRSAGIPGSEIARRLGISLSWAQKLHADPSGEIDKVRRGRNTLCECGGLKQSRSKQCQACSLAARAKELSLAATSDETLREVMATQVADLGRVPSASEWKERGVIPTMRVIERRFSDHPTLGPWNAYLEFCGLPLRVSKGSAVKGGGRLASGTLREIPGR